MRSIKELMDLSGRVALVTGGAGHVGRAVCEALAELGAAIAVLDIEEGACANTAKHVRNKFGVDSIPVVADLANGENLCNVPERVLGSFDRIDILVNNAALVGTTDLKGWTVPFLEQLPSTWRAAFEVNLTAPFILTQACTEALRASGNGSVVNVGSTHGIVGVDQRIREGTPMGTPAAAYAASKGGLIQFTRYLATILAPEVRANSVSFGGIERGQPALFRQRYMERTPLGRLGSEEDTKGAFAYLTTDLSAYVTGHNLIVDGGWLAW